MQFIKDRWLLLLVLVVFIFFKIPHLSYPFYWDESWPYASAVQTLYDHGISLIPGAIEGELSRGHPLFFHASAATWMHIFGRSNLSLHCFALFISVLFLIIIYEAGLRLFNKRAALLAVLLVAIQVVFFVQSSFLLFDMLVAFLSFASIYLYVQRKYIMACIVLAMLFYTKESGLIAGFIIGMDALISFFNKKIPIRERWYKLFTVGIPVVLIGIFFLLQKKINGWYILPMYSNLVENDWGNFWYRFRMGCVSFTFYEDYRNYFLYILLALGCIASIKNKTVRYLIILIPAVLIYYWIDDTRAGRIPSRPMFALFLVSLVYMVVLFRKKFLMEEKQYKFILLLNLYLFAFLCFSAMNFFTYRYLLASIVPMLFITAIYIDGFIQLTYKALVYPVIAVIIFCGYYAFSHDTGLGDCDLEAFNGMKVYQGLIDYMEQQNAYDKNISADNFQTREHLIDPYTGYLSSKKVFTHVRYGLDTNLDYILFDNVEPTSKYDSLKQLSYLQRVYRIEKGAAWGEVYKVVK